MFWGLILKHNKKYSQTVKKAFHLSAASLDTSQVKSGEDIQVLLNSDGNVYLLCTLNKEKVPQCSLDLNFAEGDKICFSIKGEGIVHLTGFLIPDADFLDEEESEDETMETADVKKLKNALAADKKGEKNALAKLVTNDAEDSDDDDEMDDTFDPEKQAAASSDEEDEEEAGEEADDSDDDEEDDDEEDDEEDDDDEEEEEIEKPAKKMKLQEKQKQQNGLENGKAASKEQKQKEKGQKGAEGGAKTLTGGVQVQDLKPGNGPAAVAGKKVVVYYEGRLKQNNKVFDSTKSGAGFKFRLGGGEVIKGWDVGLVGMKVGGKRRITCPPNMAYGNKGSPPVIPPNSTLVFDVELRNVV